LFFGRRYELATLTQLIEQGTRLIAITGMGGMGKTALAVKLATASKSSFQQTLWFGFHLTPPTIDSLPLLAPKTLLVFDSWDRILGGGLHQRAGQYRLEYESYAGFLRSLVQTNHSSCVILTSREQPEGLNLLSGNGAVIFPLGVLLFVGAKWLYESITLAQTCDYIPDDHLSCGEESLIPASYWGNDQPPLAKQLAIEQYRIKNFSAAEDLFKTAFNQDSDPETLIYLNNAKIQRQFPATQIRTIAVAIPLERRTTIGLEILMGAAQASDSGAEKWPTLTNNYR
jgi:hypothetical protein